jgi:hypothetical protein
MSEIVNSTPMDENKALELLGFDVGQPEGDLSKMKGHYIRWFNGMDNVTLDGKFTANELEALIFLMRKQGGPS